MALWWKKTMPKQFLNNSKTTLKRSSIRLFQPPNCQKVTISKVKNGSNFDRNLRFRGLLSTFSAENTPKRGTFQTKNNAQTIPKQLLNNFEKVQNTIFSTPKMAKNDPSNRSKWLYFRRKISTFDVNYGPLE